MQLLLGEKADWPFKYLMFYTDDIKQILRIDYCY